MTDDLARPASRRLHRRDLVSALPDLTSPQRLRGLTGSVDVWRDREGIPHARAGSLHDAFFAQGFVHAQDRLWHMEYDRRRASGRWAELVGEAAVPQDALARRLGLDRSARVDYEGAATETRVMLEAYAAGVNAFLHATQVWPIEFQLLGTRPEPWAPWDSLAVFKVRHVEMGPWQMKLWRARLVRHLGPKLAAYLSPGTAPGPMLILPPGREYRGPTPGDLETLSRSDPALASLPSWVGGSNSWVLAGTRTASGHPLVAGDPHRALDTPNCYYQNHLACPDFDAIGLSFPGVPGLSHFGHNRHVAWCVTHAMADYQDVFVERFDPTDPTRYEFRGEWRHAEVRRETIRVRGGRAVDVAITVTHHGPIVLGEPASGHAVALRYTATAELNRTFDAFVPMLRAASAGELEAAMRPWVDPGNNLVFADTGHGDDRLPDARARAGPGRDERVAPRPRLGRRPRVDGRDPVRGDARPARPGRGLDRHGQQPDRRRRLPALPRARLCAGLPDPPPRRPNPGPPRRDRRRHGGPPRGSRLDSRPEPGGGGGPHRAARRRLARGARDASPLGRFDGRRTARRRRSTRRSGRASCATSWARSSALSRATPSRLPSSAAVVHVARLRGRLAEWIREDDRTLLAAGDDWGSAMARALAGAVATLRETLGPDPASWTWGRLHVARPRHPLSAAFPAVAELLDPPASPAGGDGDTVQAADFVPAAGFELTLTSVARYVFDLGDWERSAWIVPLGASGHPGSAHYADQSADWAAVRLRPMRYDWARVLAESESYQQLEPASAG